MHRLRPLEKALVVLSVGIAAGCLWLCAWQLRRLTERRAANALVLARLSEPPVTIQQLPRDSTAQHYRRLRVIGVYDYTHAVVLASRSREGSPGINLVTPVRIAGNDTAVLVNRGWIYAPDGATANVALWREGDSLNAIGYVIPFVAHHDGDAKLPTRLHAYRWLDAVAARQAFSYPVYPYIVVLQGDTKVRGGELPRIDPPPLDEGPHFSYAIQWFAFAAIALGGAFFLVRSGSRMPQDNTDERNSVQ